MSEKIVFFDIDGTLLRTGGAGQTAIGRALTDEFDITTPFTGVATAGRTDRGITDEILDRYQIENTEPNRTRFRNAYLKHLPQSLVDSPGCRLPMVAELLDSLALQGHLILSVLTGNYADSAWLKLKHFRLDHYFRFGGFGDHHAQRNDVARNALEAASRALQRPVSGAETLIVGDTPADIECSRAIGARCLAVATGTFTVDQLAVHRPDALFADFRNHAEVATSILGLF
ncbi:MAG: HAD hydrolase-like protein [Planctomycetaceae bacterium]